MSQQKLGWLGTTIGEQCLVIAGQSPQGKFYNTAGVGLPFYQGKKDYGEKFIGEPVKWTSYTTKEALAGDILMSVRAPVGPINFSTQKICIGRGLAAIRAGEGVDKEFLYYFLLAKQNEICGNEGAVFASINKSQIESIELALPSLPEQKHIITILDEVFAGINQAVANAEKNLANARELFESYFRLVFTKQTDGWEEKKLGEVAEFKNGLNYSKSSRGQTLSVVGVGDFQNNFYVPVDDLGSATIEGELDANYEIKKDDILTVRSNGSKALIGRCMLVSEVKQQTSYSGFIIRIRFDGTKIAPKFLLWFMKSKSTVNRLTRDGGGANINNINQKILSTLSLKYPYSLREQLEIVESIDEMSETSKKLEFIYQQKLSALAELKQSILQKAFTGELTSDNVLEEVNG